jgi:cell division protein FtsQ
VKRINWQILRILSLFAVMIVLYSFAHSRRNSKPIKQTQVEFQGTTKEFLTTEMVNNLLKQKLRSYSNSSKEKVDLSGLETSLYKHPYIDSVEVFASPDGTILTAITQKTPIARVSNGNKVRYIDKKGSFFQLSDNFSARVPMVYGNIDQANKKEYVATLLAIDQDDFLKKSITQIEVLSNGSMEMNTRLHNYKILFGKPTEIEKKFKNYKVFYQYASKDTLINSYKTINLNFTQQVVCKK